MIPQPTIGSYLKGLITYNTNKQEVGHGNLIYVNSLDNDLSTFESQYHYLTANKQKQKNLLHVSLNFPQEDKEKLTKDLYTQIASEFLQEYGFPSDHPYAIYEHTDKRHPHIHIATPLILENGKAINQSFMVKKMIKIARTLEQKYGLHQVTEKEKVIRRQNKPIGSDENFEKAHEAIERALTNVLDKKPKNLKELQKQLNKVPLTYNNEKCITDFQINKLGNGITFYLKSSEQEGSPQVCKGIKGSKIHGHSFTVLDEKLAYNKRIYEARLETIQNHLNEVYSKTKSFNTFKQELQEKGISINLFETKTGETYGIEFIDNFSGMAYKGSDINKKYSWNVLKHSLSFKEKTSERENQIPNTSPKFEQKTKVMKSIRELKDDIDMIDLVEKLGYVYNKRKSTKQAAFYEKDGDKILIYNHNAQNSGYYYTTVNQPNDKGDIINLLINKNIVTGLTNKEAMQAAIRYLNNEPIESYMVAKQPEKNIKAAASKERHFKPVDTNKPGFENYISKARGIPLEVLEKHFSKSVFSTETTILKYDEKNLFIPKNSTVIPLYKIGSNGEIIGQMIRNQGFKHLIENSDKTNGYWDSNPGVASSKIAIFEDAIDAISHMVLNPNYEGKYMATIGSPSLSVLNFFAELIKDPSIYITLAGDNDIAGQHFNFLILANYISRTHQLNVTPILGKTEDVYKIKIEAVQDEQERIISSLKAIKDKDGNKIDFEIIDTTTNVSIIKDVEIINTVVKQFTNDYNIKNLASIKPIEKDFNEELRAKNRSNNIKPKL